MRAFRHVTAVLPALDEESAIGEVLGRMPPWVDRVVVADNGSRDRTPSLAASLGAEVVKVSPRGYGAACHAGAMHALERGTDLLVFLDADGSDDPAEMDRIVEPLLQGTTDLVIGKRIRLDAMRWHQKQGTQFVCAVLRLGFRHPVTDLGPFRAIRTETFRALELRDRRYGWTAEMQARALRLGLRVDEVPVSWRRSKGPSKVSGTFRGTVFAAVGLLGRSAAEILGKRADSLLASFQRTRGSTPVSGPEPKRASVAVGSD